MAADSLYWALRGVLDVTVWGGELVGETDLRRAGPAVFVANHAGAIGPIAVAASLPVRLHPWIVGDMVDRTLASTYLQKDFVQGELHLPDFIAAPMAEGLSRITVPLLLGIGCIPVWHDRELLDTLRISADVLARGGSLLIFPEDPTMPIDERTTMRPFKTGFAHLGRIYYEFTGNRLPFHPVAVNRRRRWVQTAEPIVYNPLNPEAGERRRVARLLEATIAAMLAEGGESVGARVGASD